MNKNLTKFSKNVQWLRTQLQLDSEFPTSPLIFGVERWPQFILPKCFQSFQKLHISCRGRQYFYVINVQLSIASTIHQMFSHRLGRFEMLLQAVYEILGCLPNIASLTTGTHKFVHHTASNSLLNRRLQGRTNCLQLP